MVLVTTEGVPTVLDFGIAEALDRAHLPGTLARTEPDTRLFTPAYARDAGGTRPAVVRGLGRVFFDRFEVQLETGIFADCFESGDTRHRSSACSPGAQTSLAVDREDLTSLLLQLS